jgi:hypothetical protein
MLQACFVGIAALGLKFSDRRPAMRYILSFPALALVIIAFNILGITGQWMDSESLIWDGTLPSEAEFYLKVGDFFVIAGLVALFFEIIKAARLGSGTIIDHMLSTATFIVALIEFLLVPFCGTATFFFLTIMALIDVVAGYSVSILAARRDYSISRNDGGGL